MFQINARTRLVICLVMQVVSVLLLAIPLHLVPDRRGAIMRGRASLCEAVALGGSALIQEGKIDHLQGLLAEIKKRNKEDILSIGVRRLDGEIAAEIDSHYEYWIEGPNVPVDRQARVPLCETGRGTWGSVEIRFIPLIPQSALHQVLLHPWTRLLIFMASVCSKARSGCQAVGAQSLDLRSGIRTRYLRALSMA